MPLNLFGKLFKHTILFLILAELLSLLSYLLEPLDQVAFFIILGVVLILSLIKLEYGLYILLAELFVGGHGYLFSFDLSGISLSIRMGLFLLIIAVWLIKEAKKIKKSLPPNPYHLIPYLLLFIAILIGVINGLFHNQPANVFFDFNAWIYFALLPVFLTLIKKENIQNILQVIIAATTYLSLKTIGILFLFSHNIAGIGGWFYKWVRDTGVGEITYINGTMFRIFFQSQLFCLIGFLIVLIILLYNFKPPAYAKTSAGKKNWKQYLGPAIYLYLASLAIVISQSRSFWVGGLAGLFTLIVFAWWRLNFRIKKTAILIIVILLMFVDQIFFIKILTNNFSDNIVSDRFRNLQTEAAGISRINQLEPLTYNILQQVIVGYGFGKELTYQSQDPRILKTHPNGIYTTYAFEWGYLDIWLKIGLLGLMVYLLLIVQLFFKGVINYKSDTMNIINIGLLLGLVALCTTNIFSPYLNHPLGIGYVILVSAILMTKESMLEKVKKFVKDSFKKSIYGGEMKHFEKTIDWAKKLKPNADEAILIAAYAHDLERTVRKEAQEDVFKKIEFSDHKFLDHHQEISAKIITDFLKKQNYPEAERVYNMVRHHEEGGNEEANLIKDADSISYLETNALKHIERAKNLGEDKVKRKIDWMYNRISSSQAKQLAKPFYEKALEKQSPRTKVQG